MRMATLHVLTLDQPHQAITIAANGVVEIEDNTEDDNCGHLSPLVFFTHQPAGHWLTARSGISPAAITVRRRSMKACVT